MWIKLTGIHRLIVDNIFCVCLMASLHNSISCSLVNLPKSENLIPLLSSANTNVESGDVADG